MRAESETRKQADRAAGEQAERSHRRGNAAAGIAVGVLAAGVIWLVLWAFFRVLVP